MKGRKAEINTEKKQTLVTTQYSKLAHWAKDFGMKWRDEFHTSQQCCIYFAEFVSSGPVSKRKISIYQADILIGFSLYFANIFVRVC